MFGIVVTIVIVVWKINCFIKSTFSWGWVDIYVYLVKTVDKIEVEQKSCLMCLVKNAFEIEVIKLYIYIY